MIRQAFALLMLCSLAAAAITITYPKSISITEVTQVSTAPDRPNVLQGVTLGDIAPGQALKLVISKQTGGTTIKNWQKMTVTPPQGWTKDDTVDPTRDINDLTVMIYVPLTAEEGPYTIDLEASEMVGARTVESVPLTINVRKNVIAYGFAEGYHAEAGAGEISLLVQSESLASDALTFKSVEGFPTKWISVPDLEFGPMEWKVLKFNVTPMEEGLYTIRFNIERQSGTIDTPEMVLRVKPTLKSKFRAFGEGFSIVPAILQPFYSLLSFLGI
jgi:hypothetical protein